MRTFTTERQVRGYLHKVLGASNFKVDSKPDSLNPERHIVVRFSLDGARYRFHAKTGVVEKEVPPHHLELDHSARRIMDQLEKGPNK